MYDTQNTPQMDVRQVTTLAAPEVAQRTVAAPAAHAAERRPLYVFTDKYEKSSPPQLPPRCVHVAGLGDFVQVNASAYAPGEQPAVLDAVDRRQVREVTQSLRERRLRQLKAADEDARHDNVDLYMAHGSGVIISNWATNLGMAVGFGLAARGLYDGLWSSALCGAGVATLFQRLRAGHATQSAKYSKAEIDWHQKSHMKYVDEQTALQQQLDDAGPWAGL